jgi:hypothetical protein
MQTTLTLFSHKASKAQRVIKQNKIFVPWGLYASFSTKNSYLELLL